MLPVGSCEVIHVRLSVEANTQGGAVLVLGGTTTPHNQFLPVPKDGLPKTFLMYGRMMDSGNITHSETRFHSMSQQLSSVPWPCMFQWTRPKEFVVLVAQIGRQ